MSVNKIFLGLTALALAAVPAAAQKPAKAKPQTEVKISKGEVQLPRVDTVYVVQTRTDTVRVTRLDTVRMPFRVTRAETVFVTQQAQPLPQPPKIIGPIFASMFAGTTLPSGNIDRLYTAGMHVGGLVEWEQEARFFGIRAIGSFAQLGRENLGSTTIVGTGTPFLGTLGADFKLTPFHFTNGDIYAIAGGSWHFAKGIATVVNAANGTPDANGLYFQPANDSWKGRFGYQFGGGTDFRLAQQEMFVELKAMTLVNHSQNTWFLPLSFGLRFF